METKYACLELDTYQIRLLWQLPADHFLHNLYYKINSSYNLIDYFKKKEIAVYKCVNEQVDSDEEKKL